MTLVSQLEVYRSALEAGIGSSGCSYSLFSLLDSGGTKIN